MVYPALLPLMRTPRLPVVDWTDTPADLNGLVRFPERRNLVSVRVPSHIKRRLLSKMLCGIVVCCNSGRILINIIDAACVKVLWKVFIIFTSDRCHWWKIHTLFNLLKPTSYVMHHQFNIQQPYALPTLYLCVLYLSENKQRLCATYSINSLVFITEMKSIYCAVQTGSLNKAVCASSLEG